MKLFAFWVLENNEWVAQDDIEAKGRKDAAEQVRKAGHREGCWKLRLIAEE